MPVSHRRRSSVIEAHEIYLKYHRHYGEDSENYEKEDDDEERPPKDSSQVPPDLGGRDHKVNSNQATTCFLYDFRWISSLKLPPTGFKLRQNHVCLFLLSFA